MFIRFQTRRSASAASLASSPQAQRELRPNVKAPFWKILAGRLDSLAAGEASPNEQRASRLYLAQDGLREAKTASEMPGLMAADWMRAGGVRGKLVDVVRMHAATI